MHIPKTFCHLGGCNLDPRPWTDGGAPPNLAAFTAHEVRNPLAALRAMAQLSLTSADPDVRRGMLEQIVANIDELDQFLRQMLALLRPGAVTMEKVDMGAVLRNVVQLFAVQADQTGTDIELRLPSPSPIAWGNPELLRHVFINLLKNSLEAMPDGGIVLISARQCEAHGTVRVTVKDQGGGIPEELRQSLLTDLSASSRSEGGGIGLPFVDKVVRELHEGHVTFSTKTGAGTVFCVEIPGLCPFVGAEARAPDDSLILYRPLREDDPPTVDQAG